MLVGYKNYSTIPDGPRPRGALISPSAVPTGAGGAAAGTGCSGRACCIRPIIWPWPALASASTAAKNLSIHRPHGTCPSVLLPVASDSPHSASSRL